MQIGSTSGGHAMAINVSAPPPPQVQASGGDRDGDRDGGGVSAPPVSDGSGRGQMLNIKA